MLWLKPLIIWLSLAAFVSDAWSQEGDNLLYHRRAALDPDAKVFPLTKHLVNANALVQHNRRKRHRHHNSPIRVPAELTHGLFVTSVKVGKQHLQCVIDTGSPVTDIPYGTHRPSKDAINLHHRITGVYSGGDKIDADFWLDTVQISGSHDEADDDKARITAHNVTISVERRDASVLPGKVGIIGFDFSTNRSEPGFIQRLRDTGQLSRGFTYDLGYNGEGALIMNHLVSEKEGMVYHDVTSPIWEVHGSVAGIKNRIWPDTGTTDLILDIKTLRKLAKMHDLKVVRYRNDHTVHQLAAHCSQNPKLKFHFGEQEITILPSALWTTAYRQDGLCLANVYSIGNGTGGNWIFGSVFFQSALTSFDVVGRRVGFLQKPFDGGHLSLSSAASPRAVALPQEDSTVPYHRRGSSLGPHAQVIPLTRQLVNADAMAYHNYKKRQAHHKHHHKYKPLRVGLTLKEGFFVTTLQVGNGVRRFMIDTGSFPVDLPYGAYNRSDESTNLHAQEISKYVDGRIIHADYWLDTVVMLGSHDTGKPKDIFIQVPNVTIAVEHKESAYQSDMIGVIGFDFSRNKSEPSFIQALVRNGQLPGHGFTYEVGSNGDGALILNYLVPGSHGMVYHPVTSPIWEVVGSVAGVESKIWPDSGSEDILVDKETLFKMAKTYNMKILKDFPFPGWHLRAPCSHKPKITFKFGHQEVFLFPSLLYTHTYRYHGDCIANIFSLDDMSLLGGRWILGSIFFQSVLTSFDVVGRRVGFLQKHFDDD